MLLTTAKALPPSSLLLRSLLLAPEPLRQQPPSLLRLGASSSRPTRPSRSLSSTSACTACAVITLPSSSRFPRPAAGPGATAIGPAPSSSAPFRTLSLEPALSNIREHHLTLLSPPRPSYSITLPRRRFLFQVGPGSTSTPLLWPSSSPLAVARPRPYATYRRFGDRRPGNGGGGFPGGPGPGKGGPEGNELERLRASTYAALQALWRRLFHRFGGSPPPLLVLLFALAALYYLYHLERVPITGRLRFIDVSPEEERRMGIDAYKETLREYKGRILSPSDPTSRYVRQVAQRVIDASERAPGADSLHTQVGSPQETAWSGVGQKVEAGGTEWEVLVIKDDRNRNAFVLPGGKIFVFTGILPICRNEDGLATVLGHEIAHTIARHSAEKVSSLKVLIFLGQVLQMLGFDVGLSRMGLTLLLQLPNSRKAESEADYLGLRITSLACFDPREASNLWRRMSTAELMESGATSRGLLASWLGTASGFLSTHPTNEKRIQQIETWLPEALQIRAQTCFTGLEDRLGHFKETFRFGRTGGYDGDT